MIKKIQNASIFFLLLISALFLAPMTKAQTQVLMRLQATKDVIDKSDQPSFEVVVTPAANELKEVTAYLKVRNVGFTSCEYRLTDEAEQRFFIDRNKSRTVAEANGVRMEVVVRFKKLDQPLNREPISITTISCDARELGVVSAQLHQDNSQVMTASTKSSGAAIAADEVTVMVVEDISTYSPLPSPVGEEEQEQDSQSASDSSETIADNATLIDKLFASARKVLLTLGS